MLQNGLPEASAHVARRGRFVYYLFLCLGFWGMARGKIDGTLLLVVIAVFFVSAKSDKAAVGIMGGARMVAGILLAVVPFPSPLFQSFPILLKAALEVGILSKLVGALVPKTDRQAKFWSVLWVVWSVCDLYVAWIQCGFLLKGNYDFSFAEMPRFDCCILAIYFITSAFGAPIFLYNRYAFWRCMRSCDLPAEEKEE